MLRLFWPTFTQRHTHTKSSACCSMPWFWNPMRHSKKNYADYVSLCNAYRSYTKLPRSPMLRKSQPKSATSESEVQLFSWLLVPDDLHNGWLGGIGFSSPKGFNETGPRWHSYKQSQRTSHQNSRRNQQNFSISMYFPSNNMLGRRGGLAQKFLTLLHWAILPVRMREARWLLGAGRLGWGAGC